MYVALAILFGIVFVYSVTSRALEKGPISGALIFCLLGFVLGHDGVGVLDLEVEREAISTLAELSLALILFTDAASTDREALRRSIAIPRRLLLVGLPLTILVGVAAARLLFPELSLLEAGLLAAMLAPTDAALGKPVVTSKSVPSEIREALTVESGLNDGICVPIILALLAVATQPELGESLGRFAFSLLLKEIGIGLAVGVVLAGLGSWMIRLGTERGWVSASWRQLTLVGLALLSFALAPVLGGSGFIASFTGGLAFGRFAKAYKEELLASAEGVGDTLTLITWVIFGDAVVGRIFTEITLESLVYGVLSLTVLRMVPVLVSLWGRTELSFADRTFIGWFGPRGLATIVFVVMALDAELPGGETIASAAVVTIFLSVVLHGVTANPFVRALARTRQKPAKATPGP